MAPPVQVTIVRRYANRRLYNSRSGKFVLGNIWKSWLEMARNSLLLTSGADITRSVLGQILLAHRKQHQRRSLTDAPRRKGQERNRNCEIDPSSGFRQAFVT
jgi:polyhydroxyalkanoate synthesis regulator protein